MSKKLRIGLIGLGKMGQNHLRVLSFLNKAELIFIYDQAVPIMEESAAKYGVRAAEDLEKELGNVDAVIITAPTSTHLEYIDLAARYVRNIFVEKPLTDNLKTTERVLDISRKHNLNIQVGFIERFNTAISELKKILAQSKNIINIDFTRTNKVSSRITDVDVIMDLMIHDIDLALYLNGEVENIFAYGKEIDGMIAFASAVLEHKNGRYSRLLASRVTEKKIRQISVTADSMYVNCDLLRKEVYITKQTVEQSYDYLSLSSIEEAVQVSNQEALLNELVIFIESALHPVNVDFREIPNVDSSYEVMIIANEIQKLILGGGEN